MTGKNINYRHTEGHTSDYRISVIIPTYNRAATIERAIRSVLAQSHAVNEVIVVDDGSTDETGLLVADLARRDTRVMYFRKPNGGAPAARNAGIALSTGDLVAFQDSDDEWDSRFIELLLEGYPGPNGVAFSSFCLMTLRGDKTVRPPTLVVNPKSRLLRENFISTQTVLMDRQLLDRARFDERLKRLQDWDLWLSLLDEAKFVHIPRPLVTLHVQQDSLSENVAAYFASLRIVIRKHWKVMGRSPVHFARNLVKAAIGHPIRS
jgi:glycosyltransferase involved in cell wall biosynthesis